MEPACILSSQVFISFCIVFGVVKTSEVPGVLGFDLVGREQVSDFFPGAQKRD